jgi:predicted peroxiredoxin
MTRSLLVKLTCGTNDPERCNQGMMVATSAIAGGVKVSLWLSGEAAWFAVPDKAAEFELAGATPLPELLDLVLVGGRVTVCSQCAARRGVQSDGMITGVRVAGSATFVEEALAENVQALIY